MSKKYLAITIGPMYQTFRSARHTREIWAASYLFSYIAKGLILKLIDGTLKISDDVDFDTKIEPSATKFILPNINSKVLFQKKSPYGLFPDNIIVEADILNGRNYNEIIKAVIEELSGEISQAINGNVEDITSFLTNYLLIIAKEFEVESPILDITPALSCLELEPYFNSIVDKNYLEPFFNSINKNGFMTKRDVVRFESLIEIATVGLKKNSFYSPLIHKYIWNNDKDIDSDGEFVKELMVKCINKDKNGKETNDFKTYHKYIAIVKADGDKIGAALKELKTDKEIKEFSEKLLRWGLESAKILESHQAKTIFIGGDDLLFFAPINNGKNNILDLIKELDQAFKTEFTATIPTLSFGVSITYHKYPLIEALDLADKLLADAKKKGGDRIAIQTLKHSGTEFPVVLEKGKIKYFEDLLLKMKIDDKTLVNSVGYKIRENIAVIEAIFKSEMPQKRMEALFVNVFEEEKDIAKRKDKDEYLKALRELLLFELGQNNDTNKAVKQLFSMIRTVKFIKGFEELKD